MVYDDPKMNKNEGTENIEQSLLKCEGKRTSTQDGFLAKENVESEEKESVDTDEEEKDHSEKTESGLPLFSPSSWESGASGEWLVTRL